MIHPQSALPPDKLRFIENKGQWPADVMYLAHTPDGRVKLTKNTLGFTLFSSADLAKTVHPHIYEHAIIHGHYFEEEFAGANPNVQVSGSEPFKDYENYFLGNDETKWASFVKLYPRIKYQQLYPGIDLLVTGRGEAQLKYEFELAPGADPNQIKINYKGVNNMQVVNDELHVGTSVGDFVEAKPLAWQDIDGKRTEVACAFHVSGRTLTFSLPNGYNTQYALVIDPTIIFSTYTGTSADNWGYTSTYDDAGNMYLSGLVNNDGASSFNTTPGAFQSVWANGNYQDGIAYACDIGISKFSSDGSQLIYRTYIGGSNNETPHSLVVDAQNNVIIYGVSYSADFPTTGNAFDRSQNGGADMVVVKLNSTGSALIGSTFVGGAGDDGVNYNPSEGIAGHLKKNYGDQNRGEVNIDVAGNIYVASCTKSPNFPVGANAAQHAFGGTQDGCVFKLSSNCSQLIWSTFLGGSNDDACYSFDLGPGGSVYVAGGTMSNNFPTTNGILNAGYQGGSYDGFVTRINAAGTQFLSSTYIGTNGNDQVYCIKLDRDSNVYFMGQTNGFYPVVNAAYSNPHSGQFIEKVNQNLTSVFYSTVFGNGTGKPNISPTAFLVDTCQNVYVAGWGTSNSLFTDYYTHLYEDEMYNMPLTADAFQTTTDGTDFYFFVLARDAQNILFGSYFGGNGYIDHVDGGTSRFDKRGVIYEAICAGCAAVNGSNSLTPTTPGAWSRTNNSYNCNELGLKIEIKETQPDVHVTAYPSATGCVPLVVQFHSVLLNTTSIIWYFGDGTTSTVASPTHTYNDTGTFHVLLIGKSSCDVYDTARVSVWVRNDSITANFLPNTVIDCQHKQATFVSHNYPTSHYLWDFGDTGSSTLDSVVHSYGQPGTYPVRLIVTDTTKCNLRDTFDYNIVIKPEFHAGLQADTSQGCIPLSILFSTGYTPTATYYWNFGDSTISHQRSLVHTFITVDTFPVLLVVTDSATCNITDTAHYQVVTYDSVADASFTFSRTFYNCDSVQVKLWTSNSDFDSQLWDFGDGTQQANVDTVWHTYFTLGTFTVTHYLHDSRQICKPYDTARIAFSLKPLNITVAIPDTGGCWPFTAHFTGGSNLLSTDYDWFFGDGDSSILNPVAHTYNDVGTYHVTVFAIDTNACIYADSASADIVVINDSVEAHFQLNVLNDCDSNLVIDLANHSVNALQYYWNFGDGNTSTQVNEHHVYHMPGTYTVQLIVVDTNRCHPTDTTSASVTMLPNAVTDFTANPVCFGDTTIFVNQGKPTAHYIWQFGDKSISGLYAPHHHYQGAGVYNVNLIIIDSTTCNVKDTATHMVEVYEQPIADFHINKDTALFETPVLFTNNSQYYQNLIWTLGDGTTLQDEERIDHTYETIGHMDICLVASTANCIDTLCKPLFISFKTLIGVPNAFSPNGDNINDVVRVEGKGIVEITFRIFNRWGEMVFETHDRNTGWDGYYHGTAQEMDVYTYTVDAIMINGEHAALKGNLTLLR